jgi:hypothetical protein
MVSQGSYGVFISEGRGNMAASTRARESAPKRPPKETREGDRRHDGVIARGSWFLNAHD